MIGYDYLYKITMSKYWHYSDHQTLAILAPLVTLFALGLDFYIPVVPHLKDLFECSQETMQLTLSGFMLSCAFAQIITGPLCDKYGRRPIALVSLCIFLTGSIIAPLYPNFYLMLTARLLQAVGASATFLCAYTTVRDLYPSATESAKMYSLINVCISQSPILAPAIGGYIADLTTWHSVFYLLTLISILILLSTYQYYLESSPNQHPIHFQHLKRAYYFVIINRNFQIYSLAAATGMGSFFMFFSQSPYILMDILGYSKTIYGAMFGTVGLSFFGASLMTNRLCQKMGPHYTVETGCFLMMFGGTLLIILELLFGIHALSFIIPMMMVVSGAAFTIGAGLAGTMQPFGSIAGIAFSAVGFTKFAFSACLGMLLMSLPITPLSLGLLIFILAGTSSLLAFIFRHQLIEDMNKVITIIPTEWD